jgi:hypothetical protein
MRKLFKFTLTCLSVLYITTGVAQAETLKTRIGDLSFTQNFADGYPTDATVEKLLNEIDFQRACQAYICSISIISMAQWQYSHTEQLGADNGQVVFVVRRLPTR